MLSKTIQNTKIGRWSVTDEYIITSSGERKWLCRCDCGTERYVLERSLVYGGSKSCGCQKKEHDEKLNGFLTHIDGTSLDMINSRKIPTNNTTGSRGVYFIRGKYVAKIVFQKKAYYLGTYETAEEAALAREEAEEVLFHQTVEYYRRWKAIAEVDPIWSEENPIRLEVVRDVFGDLKVIYSPDFDEVKEKEDENETIHKNEVCRI